MQEALEGASLRWQGWEKAWWRLGEALGPFFGLVGAALLGRCRVSVLLPECAGRAGAVPSSFKAKIRGNFPFGRDAARLWRGCLTLGCSQGGNNPPREALAHCAQPGAAWGDALAPTCCFWTGTTSSHQPHLRPQPTRGCAGLSTPCAGTNPALSRCIHPLGS